MKEFKFKKIDAFATANSEGNPAGYIALDSFLDITDTEMLQIAKEMRGFVNEVGYIVKTSAHEFALKYYSAEREVDFCGHATIAIMYDVMKNNPHLQQFDAVSIQTNRGTLNVENKIKEEDAVFIQAPQPFERMQLPDINYLTESLNIQSDEINPHFPISIINAGLTTLLVPIKRLEAILNITPNIEILKKFCIQSKIDIIEVFTDDVANRSNNYRTRVFAPTFGYLEDPATGSGNSAFGYYLLKNNLWKTKTITIEQNRFKDQYNIVKLQKQTDDKENTRVLFGGRAVTRIEGKYILQKS